jgi:hypothetical protein
MNERLNEYTNVCGLVCKSFFIVADGTVTSEDTTDRLSITDNVAAFHLVGAQCWNVP